MKFDFDFLKDRYDYELKRKDQITTALTLPVGILIALGAAMAAMARSFSYTDGYLTWCFLLSLGSAAVAFFLCVVNLGRAYHRQTYWYLPLLSELQTTRELYKQIYLRESYNQKESWDGDSSQQEQKVDDLFQHALEMRISEAADQNCIAPGFLDSGLTVFASTLPRPARRGRVVPERGFGSRTSPASSARCTSA